MKRPELWAVCDQLGIHRFAKLEKLYEAILEKMPQPVNEEEVQVEAEAKAEGKLDAVIINDGDAHEPWVAKVNGVEVARDSIYLRFLNWLKKRYNVINEYEQCDFNSLAIWDDESQEELEAELEAQFVSSFRDVDQLEEDLQGLVLHSETSDTQKDIDSPWVICEGRQYAVEGFTFREEKETSMQRCYEVFEDADVPSLLSAIRCERGSGRIFSFC